MAHYSHRASTGCVISRKHIKSIPTDALVFIYVILTELHTNSFNTNNALNSPPSRAAQVRPYQENIRSLTSYLSGYCTTVKQTHGQRHVDIYIYIYIYLGRIVCLFRHLRVNAQLFTRANNADLETGRTIIHLSKNATNDRRYARPK